MKKKRNTLEDIFLDEEALVIHNGTCKKILMNPKKYSYLGKKLMPISSKINDLVGVELAKKIVKCTHCYKE